MAIHTISLLTENHSGALSRVAGLFSSRGYNITSLSVAETEDPTISRMTIVVDGEETILEQILKQLNRLIDVIKVIDFTGSEVIEREMVLLTLDYSKGNRHEVVEMANLFSARLAGVSAAALHFEFSGPKTAVEDFIAAMRPFGIKEIARSGVIAIAQQRK